LALEFVTQSAVHGLILSSIHGLFAEMVFGLVADNAMPMPLSFIGDRSFPDEQPPYSVRLCAKTGLNRVVLHISLHPFPLPGSDIPPQRHSRNPKKENIMMARYEPWQLEHEDEIIWERDISSLDYVREVLTLTWDVEADQAVWVVQGDYRLLVCSRVGYAGSTSWRK
jgi:hypothetical protein